MKPQIILFLWLYGCTAGFVNGHTAEKISVPTLDVTACGAFTGRGNQQEMLLQVQIVTGRSSMLEGITLTLDTTTDPTDIDRIRMLVEKPDGKIEQIGAYQVCGEPLRIAFMPALSCIDTLRLQVCADISPEAKEGHVVAASIVSVELDGQPVEPRKQVAGRREILLCRSRLYAPGDYGSRNFRIPALRALPDGSLVAVNDKRKSNEADLPEDIDIVARRSTDNGRTWSEPVHIATGEGIKKGFGDPALMLTLDGEIICAFVGGNGLWASTLEDPQRSYIARSCDGGATWSSPEEITSALWGPQAVNPQCRDYTYSFFASGNGLTLTSGCHAGRILVAAAMGPAEKLNNHAVYSDDGGETWLVSDIAFQGGDEAKMVELTNGDILMSVRRNGQRGYNISKDGGATWGRQGVWPEMDTNACNGDIIRVAATDTEQGSNILLHSVPNSPQRRNVSIFCSYDEGKTWSKSKTICAGPSAYSSLTVLADGTIGIYVEERNSSKGFSLWFMNVSLDWITKIK